MRFGLFFRGGHYIAGPGKAKAEEEVGRKDAKRKGTFREVHSTVGAKLRGKKVLGVVPGGTEGYLRIPFKVYEMSVSLACTVNSYNARRSDIAI